MRSLPTPFFLDLPPGQRLCIHHASAQDAVRGNVVFVHAFAEEMNKSRRMAALQARAMAAEGYQVLQIDLLGCGDSSAELADASWSAWVDDVRAAAGWLNQRAPDAPLWLWGLRAGCLVAADAARAMGRPCRLLFWQPATSGKLQLQQFLRLRLASDMVAGAAKGQMAAMLQQLAAGASVEVAGYELPAAVANGLAAATLAPVAEAAAAGFIEVNSQPGAEPSPALAAAAQRWAEAGVRVAWQTVAGPPFWHTVEIEDAPGLLPATLALMQDLGP